MESLYDLRKLRERIIKEGYDVADIQILDQIINNKENELLLEDTSATGGPSAGGSSVGGIGIAGVGDVISSQPSAFPGALNGTNWINGGGTSGSGDISVPFNPSGKNRVFQSIPLGRNHGPRAGKKSRNGKLQAIKKAMMSRKPVGRILNFSDYVVDDITRIKKD